MRRDIESPTIAERDGFFPTDFSVRAGFRPEPDPFTGYTTRRTALYAWRIIAAAIVVAVLFFAVAGGVR